MSAGQHEPGDLAIDVAGCIPLAIGRPVHGRDSLDRQRFHARTTGQLERLPGRQPSGRRSQPASGAGVSEQQWCRQRHAAPFGIQIVRMLVVTDQHDVDVAESRRRNGRAGSLRQIRMGPRRIECRIHHDPTSRDVNDRGRPTQHTESAFAPTFIDQISYGHHSHP